MTTPMLGGFPESRLSPETPLDLAEALHEAQIAREAVVIAGKGLRLEHGNPVRAERLVVTTGLNRLIDYQPDDMTITVEAGMTLAELDGILAPRGQRLALDPAFPDLTTVGGLVAANPDGPWRAAFGTARDQILGLTVATPDGKVFKSGSRVVKSVAGYDLPKLFTGSYGTLGAIASVSLRVRPWPPASGAVVARWDTLDGVDPAWKRLRQAPLEPTWFELGVDPTGSFIAMGFEGEPEAVDWQQEAFERLVATPSERVADDLRISLAQRAHAEGSPLVLKVGLPPTEPIGFLSEAERQLGISGIWTGHVGNGILYGSFPAAGSWEVSAGRAMVDALRDLASERRGYVVVLRAPSAWKEGWDVWGPTRPDIGLMRAVKRAFDPQGTLSPGRFVGGL